MFLAFFQPKRISIAAEKFFARLRKHFFCPHGGASFSACRWRKALKTEKRYAHTARFSPKRSASDYKKRMTGCPTDAVSRFHESRPRTHAVPECRAF
ncbi:hypothetical protein HMPREF9441_01865 [Paraprevotella clara YIT 11840]|uniref:Uncharacterized protein n=1 Tax=Paraprevotella clara YIT 11840 TaxID=762968 RepID=G5SR75_9BACT|nr:hypothetical protein HMPREF9441_01865 [Paraprevotella clara YIT 11840]